jgi:serine/threonine protein kinase
MAQAAEESKAMESEVFKSKYRKIKVIGKGSFGEAVLVRSKLDGKRYVAKAIESQAMTPKEKRDVQNEIKILANVNHPNIIRYHEHFEDGSLIFIVMEYADGGDLATRIKDRKKTEPIVPFDPQLCMFWFLQISMALKYLHDKHVLHRDLKTANVFLTSKNVVKLGDFGISTVLQNTMACAKTVCGTPYYFSPELCQSKPYNNKSDVWALGVVFYEILTLNRPFNAKSLKELLKKILVGQYEPIPTFVPMEIRSLAASLLQVNPVQRPSINRILESSFIQESLKSFSNELQEQTAKDKAEFEEKKSTQPQPTAAAQPAQTQAQPAQPAISEKEQMAKMRQIGRNDLRAMLAQPNPELQAEMDRQAKGLPPSGQPQGNDGHPEIDDDGEYIEAKQAIITQAKQYVGKAKIEGHEDEFGDGPSSSTPQDESITLANGQSVPAKDVRKILETEMGAALLNKAVDYVSDLLSSPNAPSNAEIQRELNQLVGLRFAHNSNAIAKLAVWEGKGL